MFDELRTPQINNKFDKGSAALYLFSPKETPNQVLRPYVYKFNSELVDVLMENNNSPTLTHGLINLRHSPVVNNSIIPDAQGVKMNTSAAFSSKWLFVLVIDAPVSRMAGGIPSSNSRQIISGYCSEEPLNPLTLFQVNPTVNPNSCLVPTHCTVVNLNKKISHMGEQQYMVITSDDDTVPQVTEQLADESMFIMNPGDIRRVSNVTTYATPYTNTVVAPGAMSIGNLHTRSGSSPTRLKSPRHHLRELTYAIDTAIEGSDSMRNPVFSHSMLSDDRFGGESSIFEELFNGQLSNSSHLNNRSTTNIGVDPTHPIMLGHLISIYPGVHILPMKRAYGAQWDVRPQDGINIQNSMSSMVSSAISAICTNCGLLGVIFRYNSWANGTMSPEQGCWKIEGYSTILQMPESSQLAMLTSFKRSMEMDLFPILLSIGGHFDLTTHYDLTGEILVDLQYLDYAPVGGLYETSNMYGGMMSPMVGNMRIFENNYHEMNALVNRTMIEACGSSMGGVVQNSQVGYIHDGFNDRIIKSTAF
jgi:hypothetical protein